MDTIGSIISVVYNFVVVSFVLSFFWKFLQIPFALIGRWAVVVCHIPYFYFIAAGIAVATKANVLSFSVSPVPLLLAGSLVFFFTSVFPGSKQAADAMRSNPSFSIHFVLPFIFSVFAWFVYYFDLYFFTAPLTWIFSALHFIVEIPFIGGIISGILIAISLVCILKILIQLFSFVSSLLRKRV